MEWTHNAAVPPCKPSRCITRGEMSCLVEACALWVFFQLLTCFWIVLNSSKIPLYRIENASSLLHTAFVFCPDWWFLPSKSCCQANSVTYPAPQCDSQFALQNQRLVHLLQKHTWVYCSIDRWKKRWICIDKSKWETQAPDKCIDEAVKNGHSHFLSGRHISISRDGK